MAILLLFMNAALYGQRSDFGIIEFKKADSVAYFYQGSSLNNLPLLTHNLTHSLETEVEKFRAIYTWVCTNIKNDYGAFQRTVKKRKKLIDKGAALKEWNAATTPKVFKNLLKHKKTACTGYAYLIRELANLADIECRIIDGYGRTANALIDSKSIPNHSWNAVKLNDAWYLCDPTWSAGQILLGNEGPKFEADYFDGYFLAMPELFIRNHFPLETKWTLIEPAPSFDDFKKGPVIYKEAFNDPILPLEPKEMHQEIVKNEKLSFKIRSHKIIKQDSISIELKSGSSSKKITPIFQKHDNAYVLSHTFEKTGHFDVHIAVNDNLIATYVIRVKRQ